jgi:gluconate 2-dehydrogenase gamma chain
MSATNAAPAQRYSFLDPAEASFVEAAVDALIPRDESGPGALQLGVASYIDRQLFRFQRKRSLRHPNEDLAAVEGRPTEASCLPSGQLIRSGISDLEEAVRRKFNTSFAALSHGRRVAVLADLYSTKIALRTVALAAFLRLLLQMTVEGYLAEGWNGCDQERAAWRMKGFPGLKAEALPARANMARSAAASRPGKAEPSSAPTNASEL